MRWDWSRKPPKPVSMQPSRAVGAPLVIPRAIMPSASEEYFNYLSGVRTDNFLDGLIGTQPLGHAGGGWTNFVTGHGTFGRDKVMQGAFHESLRISDPELSSLYNGNDIAKRIVNARVNDMFRRGWCLVVPQSDEDESGEKQGPNGMEMPAGMESGPAAPGAPLVDPMGVPPDNATAKMPPGATEHDIASGKMRMQALNPSNLSSGATPTPVGQPSNAEQQTDPNREPGSPAPQVAPSAPGARDMAQPTGMEKQPEKSITKPVDNRRTAKPEQPEQDQGDNADIAMAIEAYGARLGLIPRFYEATVFGRLYGGGLLIIGADDGQDMATPLNEESIKSIRYLAWIDRRFIFAATWYTEIGPKYGEVEQWEIVNPFGGQSNTRVHETRVIRFDGAAVDFLMRRRLLGWSLSVLQAPYDTMRQFDMSFQSIANLMSDVSQAVMHINGLAQMISSDQKTLQTRMQMVDMSRSSARMVYLDAENEKFERVATPLTGVADTLEMQMLRLAAAAEMPVALLFGREPSGLNATGDADFRRWYDVVKGEQRNYLEPRLRRIHTLICLAKDGPTGGQAPGHSLEYTWHKLYEPTEKEQAEVRWLMAQADEKYVANQIVLPEEIATSRFRSGELHLDTEIDLELRHEALETAELPPSGAEKAEQDQQNKESELKISAQAAAAKGPPGAGTKPGAGVNKPTAGRADAWEEARVDAAEEDVHEMMLEDFPESALGWVKAVKWRGPTKIQTNKIDYSNRAKWHASKESEKPRVDKFAEMIKSGEGVKPIVLVQKPDGSKAMIVDGHHRALAYRNVGAKIALAYVAKVGKVEGPWDETHDFQSEGPSGKVSG